MSTGHEQQWVADAAAGDPGEPSENYAIVEHEASNAYGDALTSDMQNRQLWWRASLPLKPDEAHQIALDCIGHYNAFDPDCLSQFPADCKIWLARELSVCLYVKPGATPTPTRAQLFADECDPKPSPDGAGGCLRYWWD